MKLDDKVVVVSGAGSGMGRALCLQLKEKKARLAMLDLHAETLQETLKLMGSYAEFCSIHVVDISQKSEVDLLPTAILQAHGQIDVVINNAGIIQPFVPVNELNMQQIERVMNVNFYGTLYMCKAFIPYLLQRPEAHIANVASMGAFIPFPGQSIYGASKAAVKLLTEGLFAELMNTKVGITLIMPGAVNTHITENSGLGTPKAAKTGEGPKMLEAAEAAQIMLKGIEQKKLHVLVGKDASMLNKLYRLSPLFAIKTIVKKMSGMM
ncbi:MAG: SDR family oxidoreductase [Bacteroidetes bacterium]|nr:MAG: SDR family oxidoreductase [Bacteroidota bacterium]